LSGLGSIRNLHSHHSTLDCSFLRLIIGGWPSSSWTLLGFATSTLDKEMRRLSGRRDNLILVVYKYYLAELSFWIGGGRIVTHEACEEYVK
jgi:hypothetical protein